MPLCAHPHRHFAYVPKVASVPTEQACLMKENDMPKTKGTLQLP